MDTLKVMAMSGVTAVVVVALLMLSGAFKSDTLGGVPGVSILPSAVTPTVGLINATSSPTGSTLATADIDDENVVAYTLTQSSGTLTFPASSSFPGIPNAGDSRVIWVRHATTSASVNLTIAGGTGAQLKIASSSVSSAVLGGDTDGNNSARIEAVRKADSNIVLYMQKYID